MSEPSAFLDACLAGDALLSDVDDWVDRWHDAHGAPSGLQIPLREYLGLTPDEYALWVEQPGSLRFAAAARKADRPAGDVRAVASTALAAARTGDDAEARGLIRWLRQTGRIPADDLAG